MVQREFRFSSLFWLEIVNQSGPETPRSEAEQVPAGTRFLDWSDVPMLSDDFQGSRDKIYAHVVELVEELAIKP